MREVILAAGAALALLAVGCSGGGEAPSAQADTSPGAENTESTGPDATNTATVEQPTGWDILRKSDAAMGSAGYVITEVFSWNRDGQPSDEGVIVEEVHGKVLRYLAHPDKPAECVPQEASDEPLANRRKGALWVYHAETGATAPEEVELLREEQYEGEMAWVIRFRYLLPSIEGPFPREHTEWIAKDDYRLLRQELEVYDPFGFKGQAVVRFVEYRDDPSECPRGASLTRDELRPMTAPRLENPYEYR